MISVDRISNAVSRYLAGEDSRAAFEDWFSVESWNAHRYASERLMNLIADIEVLFSRLHIEGMAEADFRRALDSTMDPFERRSQVVLANEREGLFYRLVVPDANTPDKVRFDDPIGIQVAQSEAMGLEVFVRKLPVEEPWQLQVEATSLAGIPYWIPAASDAQQG